MMSKKVYVGNLPFKYKNQDLTQLFSKFGQIEDAVIIFDRATRRSKGFGFVTFVNDSDADTAIKEMNQKEAEGRPLTVNEARPREEKENSLEEEKVSEEDNSFEETEKE